MPKPTDPGSQGRPDQSQPNPAGHVRGSQRPDDMTEEQWEEERKRVNRERFVSKHGREPGPDDDVEEQPPTG
ncbi:MAG: hypothetical protein DMF62_04720 [Acidobacteria bacterium]|nr:MAG: hypothetical protein DMF62_04720 [Acidobacteriota bacterium]